MNSTQVYLASKSPRRSQLLQQLELDYVVQDVQLDESCLPDEAPLAYVQRVAMEKALAARECVNIIQSVPVLAADTCIVLDNDIIGKPRDRQHGLDLLRRLSGRSHEVYTAVAVCGEKSRSVTTRLQGLIQSESQLKLQWRENGQTIEVLALNKNSVEFRPTTETEREAYWETGEPWDKAGAYAIQGKAAIFIRCIHGSYSGIMGLPLYETNQILGLFGVNGLQTSSALKTG